MPAIHALMTPVAYGVYLAAVDPHELAALRAERTTALKAESIIGMSHLVGSWNPQVALNAAVEQILDVGAPLHERFWHPLRGPIAHEPEQVSSLDRELRRVWLALPNAVRTKHPFRHEIARILELLELALRDELAVISVLEPPEDEERATKVLCPFESETKLPFAWGTPGLF